MNFCQFSRKTLKLITKQDCNKTYVCLFSRALSSKKTTNSDRPRARQQTAQFWLPCFQRRNAPYRGGLASSAQNSFAAGGSSRKFFTGEQRTRPRTGGGLASTTPQRALSAGTALQEEIGEQRAFRQLAVAWRLRKLKSVQNSIKQCKTVQYSAKQSKQSKLP